MAYVQFIERAFPELRNLPKIEKGTLFEKQCSIHFHSEGIPLLVSDQFLRKRHSGQADLARITGNCIEIAEVKSSKCNVRRDVLKKQVFRLTNSGKVLSFIFGKTFKLTILVG